MALTLLLVLSAHWKDKPLRAERRKLLHGAQYLWGSNGTRAQFLPLPSLPPPSTSPLASVYRNIIAGPDMACAFQSPSQPHVLWRN